MIGTCRPQCQNYQASVLGLRGNGNYLLEAHSCQCMHHFSTHYNIQVTLPPILLGKLKTEPKSTFHTLFWLSGHIGEGLHLLKQLDTFAVKSWTKQCRKRCKPKSAAISNKNTSALCSFTVFWKLPFPLPISPCLSWCPLSFAELCSVSFLPQFNPSRGNLCDEESL